MATRAEMRVEIEALAEAQGVDIPSGDLDHMNHPNMTSLLEAFKAQAAPAESEPEPKPPGEDPLWDSPLTTEPAAAAEDEGPLWESPLTAPPTPTVDGTNDDSLGGPPPKDSPKYRWPYTVAQGRAVTTARRGTIGAFGRVRASDFAGGQAQLDELVASGHVAKKS